MPACEAPLGRGRRHSLERDRVAVRHHYDVSNAFYRLVLGPTMVYSCAYFTAPTTRSRRRRPASSSPSAASCACARATGCWTSAAAGARSLLHAAREHGARAVGVTLSEPQAELARERIRDAGLSDRCEIRVADYREVDDGPYDKVASVGMYEHVGRAQLARRTSAVCTRLLRAGGLFLNHGIVRAQPRPWDKHSFIARYVFPDGELHPVGAVVDAMEQAGLEIRDDESLREHYALTLRRWVANLAANRDAAIAEAGTERERVWRLLHDRLGGGLRGGRHLRAPGARRQARRPARAAAGPRGAPGQRGLAAFDAGSGAPVGPWWNRQTRDATIIGQRALAAVVPLTAVTLIRNARNQKPRTRAAALRHHPCFAGLVQVSPVLRLTQFETGIE